MENSPLFYLCLRHFSPLRPPYRIVILAMGVKSTVLVAKKLREARLNLLKEFADVDCSYNLTPEELCTKISLCDALIVRSGTKVSREVFELSGGRLKVVGRAGVGIDNVDLAAAATEHECLVVNASTANTVAAAEHGIALLTAMARTVAQADASVQAGKITKAGRNGRAYGKRIKRSKNGIKCWYTEAYMAHVLLPQTVRPIVASHLKAWQHKMANAGFTAH